MEKEQEIETRKEGDPPKEVLASTLRIEAQKKLYDLWVADNNMLNTKLSQLFYVNSILVAVLALSAKTDTQNSIPYWASLLGGLFSLLWFFSIERTLAFRKYYKRKLSDFSGVDTIPFLITDGKKADDFPRFARWGSDFTRYISLISFAVWFLIFLRMLLNDFICLAGN